MEQIECRRCGEEAPRLPRPPFRNELGRTIHEEICRSCWSDWLDHQTLLINHYGLDVRDPDAREFLAEQIRKVLLEGEEGAEVDTSEEGQVDW